MVELPENVTLEWIGQQLIKMQRDLEALRDDAAVEAAILRRVENNQVADRAEWRSLVRHGSACARADGEARARRWLGSRSRRSPMLRFAMACLRIGSWRRREARGAGFTCACSTGCGAIVGLRRATATSSSGSGWRGRMREG